MKKSNNDWFGALRQQGRLLQTPEAQEIFDDGVSRINSAWRYTLDTGEVEAVLFRRLSERGISSLLQKQGTYTPEDLAKLKKSRRLYCRADQGQCIMIEAKHSK